MFSVHKILIICVAVQCLQVNTSPILQGISFHRSFVLNFKPWIKEPIQFIKEKWSPLGHFAKKIIIQKRSLDDMVPPIPRPAAPVFEATEEEPIGTGPLHIVAKAPVYTSLPKVPPPLIPLPKPMPIIVNDYPPPLPIVPPISSNMVIIQPSNRNSDVSSNTLYTDISRVQSIEKYIRSYEITPKPPVPPPPEPAPVQPIVSPLPPTPIPPKPEIVITPVPPAPVMENISAGIVAEPPPPTGGVPLGPVAPPPKPLLPPPPVPPPPAISPPPPLLSPPPPPISPPPPPPPPPEPLPASVIPPPPPPPPPPAPLPPPPPPPVPLPPPPPPVVEPVPVPEVLPPKKPEVPIPVVPEAPAPILPVPIKEEPKEKPPPPPQEVPKTEVVVKENTLVKGSKIALQFGSVFLTLMAQFFDRARATIELMTNPPPKFAE